MSNALSEIHFLLPVAISFLTIAGDRVSMACKIINTARDFPQLDFTVPNDTNFWVWDDVMEQKYWKRLKRWKQMPLKVFVVPFSHVDAFWVQTFEEYYRTRTSHILDNLVTMMPRLPEMTFVWSDIAFLAYWWERASEKSQNTLKDLVARGRLEIVTGGWVMPDEATTSLYALFTQLIEGHEWLYDNLQVIPETAWSIDPFGLSSTMPYLLAASGVRGGLLIQRIHFAWQRLLGHLGHSELIWRQSWDANSTHEMKLRVQHTCTYVVTDTCGPATPLCQFYDFAQQLQEIQYKEIRKKIEVLLGQYGRLGSLSRGNHLVVPLGGDFRFANSSEWARQYSNYKAIMDYVNHNSDLYNAHIEFTTLKEFFTEVGIVDLKVEGDFFPYSDYTSKCLGECKMKSSYWTGYYTTRPRLKLLSSSVGAKLRAVEILFTLGALSWCKEGTSSETTGRFWAEEAQRKLIWARRAWSLFQHHDGITGTSTSRVMKQQTKRLKRAGQYLRETLEGLVTRFLYSTNATANSSSTPRPSTAYRNKQEARKYAKIVVYNSIELTRNDLMAVIIPPNIGRVEVSEKGQPLPHQVVEKGSDTLVYFKTNVPPFSLKILKLVEYEGDPVYSTRNQRPTSDEYFTLCNNVVSLFFEQGILVALVSKDYGSDINIRIGTYDVYPGYNGAYLFKPCPKVEYFQPSKDAETKRGPIFKELRTAFDCCSLTIRILNEDENPVIHVSVEYLLQMDDKELFLEINTGVKSVKWMTDMNDFELKERVQVESEGLQANIYPMTSISYVESDEERLVVISDHSHGVANPRQGVLQVMLDRRTTMDDGKGMGEPLRDNTKTVSKFLVVLYRFPNLTVDILGLSRRFSNPPLALTIRSEDISDDKQYSIPKSQPKDQCFPREYLFPGDWDVPRAFIADLFRTRDSMNRSNDSPEESTIPSTEAPNSNGLLLSDETYLLLQGGIVEGIRILTLRTRQLSGESPGWALLVLHNTSNTTVSPFPSETTFYHLQLTSIVETTLTGIEEIEQYAVLSDIVMPPHTLKSVKLRFKTSIKYQ